MADQWMIRGPEFINLQLGVGLSIGKRKGHAGLLSRFGEAYRKAEPRSRKLFNQAVFEEIGIEVDGEISHVKLAQPFRALLDPEFPAEVAR